MRHAGSTSRPPRSSVSRAWKAGQRCAGRMPKAWRARNELWRFVVFAVLAVAVALVLAMLLVRSIVMPLRHALQQIAERDGDLTRLPVPGTDELSRLLLLSMPRMRAWRRWWRAFSKALRRHLGQWRDRPGQRRPGQPHRGAVSSPPAWSRSLHSSASRRTNGPQQDRADGGSCRPGY
ncbi:HAMP domain-containing protein [Billgrantia gudaonensis]|uniref:HAMP domain-containing protein n=1 Tax=Billgrantia gudaonensis TaxID=376427 RepID=A0A3S0QGC5_9GAMM|nr:HAMP domain-containing protein [Halomonas gudaonensis]